MQRRNLPDDHSFIEDEYADPAYFDLLCDHEESRSPEEDTQQKDGNDFLNPELFKDQSGQTMPNSQIFKTLTPVAAGSVPQMHHQPTPVSAYKEPAPKIVTVSSNQMNTLLQNFLRSQKSKPACKTSGEKTDQIESHGSLRHVTASKGRLQKLNLKKLDYYEDKRGKFLIDPHKSDYDARDFVTSLNIILSEMRNETFEVKALREFVVCEVSGPNKWENFKKIFQMDPEKKILFLDFDLSSENRYRKEKYSSCLLYQDKNNNFFIDYNGEKLKNSSDLDVDFYTYLTTEIPHITKSFTIFRVGENCLLMTKDTKMCAKAAELCMKFKLFLEADKKVETVSYIFNPNNFINPRELAVLQAIDETKITSTVSSSEANENESKKRKNDNVESSRKDKKHKRNPIELFQPQSNSENPNSRQHPRGPRY